MEKPLYFQCGKHQLFGVIHEPDVSSMPQKTGIVFCAPFAEEKLWSHRVFVNFSRLLAKQGYYSFRFDYRGHGDSDCRFEEATIQTRIQDIQQAVSTLRMETSVDRVGFLGLRLGATLAILACEKDETNFLILWEPILEGEKYIQQCLRSNLATQMTIHRKIIKTREQLVDDLNSGTHVNIDGYLVPRDFYQQIIKIDLNEKQAFPKLPILFCKIEKIVRPKLTSYMERIKSNCEGTHSLSCYKTIQENAFWNEQKVYYQRAESLFEETMKWLRTA